VKRLKALNEPRVGAERKADLTGRSEIRQEGARASGVDERRSIGCVHPALVQLVENGG
jgi:hypothetical protein